MMRNANEGNRPHLRRLFRQPVNAKDFGPISVSNTEQVLAFFTKSDPVGNARFEFVAFGIAAVALEDRSLRSIVPYTAVPMRQELVTMINGLSRTGATFVGNQLGRSFDSSPLRRKSLQSTMLPRTVDLAVAAPNPPVRESNPGNLEQMFHGTQGLVDLVGKQWLVEAAHEAARPLFPAEDEKPTGLTLGEAVLRTRGQLISMFEWYEKTLPKATPELFDRIVGDDGPLLPVLGSNYGLRS